MKKFIPIVAAVLVLSSCSTSIVPETIVRRYINSVMDGRPNDSLLFGDVQQVDNVLAPEEVLGFDLMRSQRIGTDPTDGQGMLYEVKALVEFEGSYGNVVERVITFDVEVVFISGGIHEIRVAN
ncbi:MAG: hypothetical protein PF508_18840 [Spirochaeta sp.]|jgi:hypothetical protein|nr:hypothetical protein [Spirochaeta sp.]